VSAHTFINMNNTHISRRGEFRRRVVVIALHAAANVLFRGVNYKSVTSYR